MLATCATEERSKATKRLVLLIVLSFVVPTELTENTEAYGLKFLESTERIDAARHTTECTEMIACNML